MQKLSGTAFVFIIAKERKKGKNTVDNDTAILFVDDNENLAKSVTIGLEKNGYKIDIANEPVKALEMLASHHYHILISDINMPRLNGALLAQVASQLYPHMHIILITAYDFSEYENDYPAIKSMTKLAKPFELTELVSVVDQKVNMYGHL